MSAAPWRDEKDDEGDVEEDDEGDVDDDPEVTEIDPPAGMTCHDFNKDELLVGDVVRVRATGTVMVVGSIVYLGFEDREAANDFSEPGFMVSPNENGTDLVNAGGCEKIKNVS